MVLKDTCPVVRSYISSREIHSCAIITGYWSRRVKPLYFKLFSGGVVLVLFWFVMGETKLELGLGLNVSLA